jgi:hypothetical protein
MKIINEKLVAKSVLILTVISLCLISINGFAGETSKKESEPMITAVEGIIVYYVKVGDKVKKGEPLFFVEATDYPLGEIRKIKQDIVYYKKTYNRKTKLAKTQSLSVQEMDDAWRDYHNALNDLAIATRQARNGFYTAPYDCEIVSCAVPNTSGIADGEAGVHIKKISAE